MWLKSYHGFLVELVVYFYVKNLDIPSHFVCICFSPKKKKKKKRRGKQVRPIEFRSKMGHLNRRVESIKLWIGLRLNRNFSHE